MPCCARKTNFVNGLSILAVLSLLAVASPALGLDKRCEDVRNVLQQKGTLLRAYLNNASKPGIRDDSEIVKDLGAEIGHLRDEILNLEKELEACKGERAAEIQDGISAVKSEEGQYAAKSCRELTRRLVVLVRAVNHFRRREHSSVSEFTSQEKKAFREAAQELEAVRDALRARCSAPSEAGRSQRGAKP